METAKHFARTLRVLYHELLVSQTELYSVRDEDYDIWANKNGDKLDISRVSRVKLSCESLWGSARRAVQVLKEKYEENPKQLMECCTGFFVSETWLGEKVVGDSFLICDSWDSFDSCLERVRTVFPDASSRWDALAHQIVRTRKTCLTYFMHGTKCTVDVELIKNVHKSLVSDGPKDVGGEFRKSPSSNDSALPYLRHEDIEVCLFELLKFVNEQQTTTFEERLLLAVLFFERFLWIHPFQEGNGRTARFLFSLLLAPDCPSLPLPMFWRTSQHPREFYIHSIRANPSQAPICLAYYVLKCVNENVLRVLDTLSPGALFEEDIEEAKFPEADLTESQKSMWQSLKDTFPSLKWSDIKWLEKSPSGFLVILGTESYKEPSAVVHRTGDISKVRSLTVNCTWNSAKILRHSDLFGSDTLIGEIVRVPPPPHIANAAFELGPESGSMRMVCDIVVCSLPDKIFQATSLKFRVIVDTGSPQTFMVIPATLWNPGFLRDNDHSFIEGRVGPSETHRYLQKFATIVINGIEIKDEPICLSRGRKKPDSSYEAIMYGFDGILGMNVVEKSCLVICGSTVVILPHNSKSKITLS